MRIHPVAARVRRSKPHAARRLKAVPGLVRCFAIENSQAAPETDLGLFLPMSRN